METMMIIGGVLVIAVGVGYGYVKFVKGYVNYRQAKGEIRAYVESYQSRCTGENRFVCTIDTLQNAFIQYDTNTIRRVWVELIDERLIEKHPIDREWSILK